MILHVYSEHRWEEQSETFTAIADLRRAGYHVESRLTTIDDDASYWKVLMEYWGKEELIHIQQDVVPTVEMVQRLMSCDHQACTCPHKLRSGFGLYRPHYAGPWQFLPSSMEVYLPPFPTHVGGSGRSR